MGQRVTGEEEQLHAKVAREAKEKGLSSRRQFELFKPLKEGSDCEAVVNTRRVLTWRTVDCTGTAKACLAARGYRDPDSREGNVDSSARVSFRSSHLHVVFLAALKAGKIRGLDIRAACLQKDGVARDVCLRAPADCGPSNSRRMWKSRAPAFGSYDAPVASRAPLQKYLLNSVESLANAGLEFRAPSFDSCRRRVDQLAPSPRRVMTYLGAVSRIFW